MKRFILLLSSAFFIANGLLAQTTAITDSSLTYVPGEGVYLKLGKQESNKFNLNATVQSGLQINKLDSANTTINSNRFSLNLVRVAFTASVMRDKVSMGFVTDFTGVTPILEGWIAFSMMNKHGKLYFGQKQTHTNNRLAMADERYAHNLGQTLAGKSNDGVVYGGLMQYFVGATREGGLFLETNFGKSNGWKFYPSVSITTGEGQNFFGTQTNTGFKYGGRIDVLPMGDFIKNNAFIAEDIYHEPKPKLAIGVAASYNVKAASPIGSDNATIVGIYNKAGTADFANYAKMVADVIFKSNGFAIVGEYVNGTVRGKELYTNAAATTQFTEETASKYYNLGSAFNLQTSYVTKNGWSVGARYANIKPEFTNAISLVRQQDWYTFTLNKYMKGNAVKAGLNVTYLSDNIITSTTKRWMINLAIQISL
jgi:hypothetical protein